MVGGGLAGLSAAMKLAENGCHVKIVSVTKVNVRILFAPKVALTPP